MLLSEFARHYRRSSSLKMALLFTLLLGVCTCILGYFIYQLSEESFIRETEAAIDADMENIREWVARDSEKALPEIISRRSSAASTKYYLLLDSTENKLAGNIESLPKEISLLAEGLIMFRQHDRQLAAKIDTFDDGKRLLVARDIEAISRKFERMQWLSVLIIVLMAVVITVSFIISTFVVSRTKLIARTAEEIMQTGDLSRRISIQSGWDDLSQMAHVLNALLARIESSLIGIRQVSDNIAHDLRTPLTRLRNQLEGRGDTELVSEADQLLKTFAALLRISNIEVGRRHAVFQTVELGTVLKDVIELYEPLAEEKHITLSRLIDDVNIEGDRDLLFQMLANLLDNALKFTPEHGSISLALNEHELIVSDSGQGIPDTEKEHVFKRFYRTENSRSTAGNGLGLSLVAAVAVIHNLEIILEDQVPGLRVILKLTNR